MVFYKVKPQYDGAHGARLRHERSITYEIYADELFTQRELDLYRIPKAYCTKVNVPKNKTFYHGVQRYDAREYRLVTILRKIEV